MTNFQEPNLIAQLATCVCWAVEHETAAGWNPALINVVHVMTTERMVMYTARVTIPKMSTRDVIEVLEKLHEFCFNDDRPICINGMNFLLGDGDDSDAVWFENGDVCIWLRHWPRGQ